MVNKTNSEFENNLSYPKDFEIAESQESSEQINEEEEEEEEEEDIIDIDQIEEDNFPHDNTKDNLSKTLKTTLAYNNDDLKLETLDLNIVSKEDAVNFLLYKTKFEKSTKSMSPSTKRMRNKNRYTKVKSMFNRQSNKPNYFLNLNSNPENTYDFNTALTRLVASKMNDKTEDIKLKKALISKRKVKKIETVE